MTNDIHNESYTFHFIFRENSIILKDDKLPDLSLMQKCLDHNVASDWFSEKELGYSAMLLEDDSPDPAGCTDIPIREFFWNMKDSEETKRISSLAARAKGLLNFRKNKRYCSLCGGALHDDDNFTAKTCAQCGHVFFPQIEPAVIVLVTKGKELLLAKHRQRTKAVWTTLAGFVETGETIENAVSREIKEETNIDVKNIRYVASQAWPFPDQLMLAFRAEYAGGEIKVQEEEIVEARWFSQDSLPETPPPGSVAYNLIHGIYE